MCHRRVGTRFSVIELALILLGLLIASLPEESWAGLSRQGILDVFSKYEELNQDFMNSGDPGKGQSRKSHVVSEDEIEQYASGPFQAALDAAQIRICKHSDVGVLRGLFHALLATQNSADEAPAWTLGQVFVCRPALVEREFKVLPSNAQAQLYGILEFGFENAVYRRPPNDLEVAKLRGKLQRLEPRGSP